MRTPACVAASLIPVLNSEAQLALWRGKASALGRTLPATVQVDSGQVITLNPSASGAFQFTPMLPLNGSADGRHIVTFAAINVTLMSPKNEAASQRPFELHQNAKSVDKCSTVWAQFLCYVMRTAPREWQEGEEDNETGTYRISAGITIKITIKTGANRFNRDRRTIHI